jgi:hypothetical protein
MQVNTSNLRFNGLYRLKFNPVGRTNQNYLDVNSAGSLSLDIAQEWFKTHHKPARAFMVDYPKERDPYEKKLPGMKIEFPNIGTSYDLFLATNEGPNGENTCTKYNEGIEDPNVVPFRTNASGLAFVNERLADIKTIEVDYEDYRWEEDLPLRPTDPPDVFRRYQPHTELSVQAWRTSPENPFSLYLMD